jgi:hypothetical protein
MGEPFAPFVEVKRLLPDATPNAEPVVRVRPSAPPNRANPKLSTYKPMSLSSSARFSKTP